MSKTVILTFEGTKPKIIIENDGISSMVIDSNDDLYTIAKKINSDLELEVEQDDNIDFLKTIYQLSENGIINDFDSYTDVDTGNRSELGLDRHVQDKLSEKIMTHEDFSKLEGISRDVLLELNRNQNLDTLAFIVDQINLVLISKIIEVYNLNKARKIELRDNIGLIRLQQMLSRELSGADIVFEII